MSWPYLVAVVHVAVLVGGCDRPSPQGAQLTKQGLAEILDLSPLPATPPSRTNAFADNPEAARFGQHLFYDKRLSANGEISCATCHDPAHGFSDGKPLSEGLQTTTRHANALWNAGHQRWFFWDGRADSLWAQSLGPLQSEAEMGATPLQAWNVVAGDDVLRGLYESLFGPMSGGAAPDSDTLNRFLANFGKAIES